MSASGAGRGFDRVDRENCCDEKGLAAWRPGRAPIAAFAVRTLCVFAANVQGKLVTVVACTWDRSAVKWSSAIE